MKGEGGGGGGGGGGYGAGDCGYERGGSDTGGEDEEDREQEDEETTERPNDNDGPEVGKTPRIFISISTRYCPPCGPPGALAPAPGG
jgi:hypothetical protein